MSADKRIARRRFLQQSAAVAGASLAASLPLARCAHASGSDVLKLALIGCGGRGTGAAMNCLNAAQTVKLVAMADMFADRLETSRQSLRKVKPEGVEVDDAHCFVGFDAYQHAIQSGADVVILAAPGGFRPQHARAAVAAGKHVFMEKPSCVDAPGFRSILETAEIAEQKGLKMGGGYPFRHHAGVAETIRRIHDGAIGEIRSIDCSYQTGALWHRGHQPEWSEMEFQLRNWIYFAWQSGDIIVEQATHRLDIAHWVKQGPPARARGTGGRKQRTGGKYGDVFDWFEIEYSYADGTTLLLHSRQWAGATATVEDVVTGRLGKASIIKTEIEGQANWKYEGPRTNMYDEEMARLVGAIREGQPYNEAKQAAITSMIGVLGRMAAYEGREITWDEAIRSGESYAPAQYAMDAPPPTLPDKFGDYAVPYRGKTA